MSDAGKVALVAPYWGSAGHVGYKRAARFARWLAASGREVVIVRAGAQDEFEHPSAPEGCEPGRVSIVTVRDPLGLKVYTASGRPAAPEASGGTSGSWKSALVNLAFVPDPTAAWAKAAARHAAVLERCAGAEWVVSSSPPESCHLAAFWIAERTGARLCADMRDGWLDEPLKPLLQKWAWRRWLEGRWEARVLRRAERIFVTSEVWLDLLNARLPFTRGKTTVLTNACAPGPHPPPEAPPDLEMPVLIHAGRLAGSRNTQTLEALLAPLRAVAGGGEKAGIVLLGSLASQDLAAIARMREEFEGAGWTLSHEPALPQDEMQERLRRAHGLLLLCVSRAPIPSKLFDYLAARRPILCVTPEGSALWRAVEDVPQAVRVDPFAPGSFASESARFLTMCRTAQLETHVPERFLDESLREVFLDSIGAGRPG